MAIVPWAAARLLVLQFGFAVWHAKRAARQEEFPHTGIRTSCGGEEQERPLLSILIPARNDEANLGACIASILVDAGIDTDIEVWIVDDESSDGTPCIAEAASRFDSRVRWFPGAPGADTPTMYRQISCPRPAGRQSEGTVAAVSRCRYTLEAGQHPNDSSGRCQTRRTERPENVTNFRPLRKMAVRLAPVGRRSRGALSNK